MNSANTNNSVSSGRWRYTGWQVYHVLFVRQVSVQVCPGLIACMHGQRVNSQLRAGSSRYRHKQVGCVA